MMRGYRSMWRETSTCRQFANLYQAPRLHLRTEHLLPFTLRPIVTDVGTSTIMNTTTTARMCTATLNEERSPRGACRPTAGVRTMITNEAVLVRSTGDRDTTAKKASRVSTARARRRESTSPPRPPTPPTTRTRRTTPATGRMGLELRMATKPQRPNPTLTHPCRGPSASSHLPPPHTVYTRQDLEWEVSTLSRELPCMPIRPDAIEWA
jgi:hypothetical protein